MMPEMDDERKHLNATMFYCRGVCALSSDYRNQRSVIKKGISGHYYARLHGLLRALRAGKLNIYFLYFTRVGPEL